MQEAKSMDIIKKIGIIEMEKLLVRKEPLRVC